MFTCGFLRYWEWEPYVGCFELPSRGSGHAVCLIRADQAPLFSLSFEVAADEIPPAARFVLAPTCPWSIDGVSGISCAMQSTGCSARSIARMVSTGRPCEGSKIHACSQLNRKGGFQHVLDTRAQRSIMQ